MIAATPPAWADLKIPNADFDVAALAAALDARRTERGLSWSAMAREVNRTQDRVDRHPISSSTIRGLAQKPWGVEGDGVLQMLLWLDRTPESFVPGHPGADHPDARLPQPGARRILRFDVPAISARLEEARATRSLAWAQVAVEIGGRTTADALRNMQRQQRTAFPHVMRIARWLACPAAALTRIADW